jgi:hypothetical protein
MDVLLVLLIVFLFGALPTLPYSASGRTRFESRGSGASLTASPAKRVSDHSEQSLRRAAWAQSTRFCCKSIEKLAVNRSSA